MAETATKAKPAEPAPETVTGAASAAAAMLEEVRQASKQMLEDAREQALAIAETAGDRVLTQERKLVEQAQKDFATATSDGPGKVWQAHERQEGYEPVVFTAKGGKKSELRINRIGRQRYERNGVEQVSPGVAYQFSQGEFEALSEDVETYLRGRPSFNVEFWVAGDEPHSAPDPGVMLDKVLEATLDFDVDRLQELLERERASHNRPLVVRRIEGALRSIHGRTKEA